MKTDISQNEVFDDLSQKTLSFSVAFYLVQNLPLPAKFSFFKFSPTLKLCLATATHNFKVDENYSHLVDLRPDICNDVSIPLSFSITVI